MYVTCNAETTTHYCPYCPYCPSSLEDIDDLSHDSTTPTYNRTLLGAIIIRESSPISRQRQRYCA